MGRYVYGGAAISFGQAVNVSFDLLREHGLRLDPSLTLAVKALMAALLLAPYRALLPRLQAWSTT